MRLWLCVRESEVKSNGRLRDHLSHGIKRANATLMRRNISAAAAAAVCVHGAQIYIIIRSLAPLSGIMISICYPHSTPPPPPPHAAEHTLAFTSGCFRPLYVRRACFCRRFGFVQLINWFVSAAKGDLFLAGACKQITQWLSTLARHAVQRFLKQTPTTQLV